MVHEKGIVFFVIVLHHIKVDRAPTAMTKIPRREMGTVVVAPD